MVKLALIIGGAYWIGSTGGAFIGAKVKADPAGATAGAIKLGTGAIAFVVLGTVLR